MATTSIRDQDLRAVSRDPSVHSGDLVFSGTRVPVAALIDYLKGGHGIEDFLAGFPTVERWQVEAFLDASAKAVDELREKNASAA